MAATGYVVTVNVPFFEPAGRNRDAGTVATEVLELVSAIVAPAGGALPVSVTIAVEGFPPTGFVGLRAIDVSAATPTVSVAVLVTPPWTPVIVTAVE